MITWIKVSRVKTSVLQFRWKKIRLHTCTIGDVNVRYHWMYRRKCRVCSHFDLDVPTEIRHRLTPPLPHLFPYGREGERRRGHARILKGGGGQGVRSPCKTQFFFFTNYSKKLPKICLGPPPNSYNRRTPPPPGGKKSRSAHEAIHAHVCEHAMNDVYFF